MHDLVVSAPGKLMLMGEYAVLRGAPALVTAVDARLQLKKVAHDGGDWPEVMGASRAACAALGLDAKDLGFFRDDAALLGSGGLKFGLGSSAAGAAAAAGWVYAKAGYALSDSRVQHRVFESALLGHRSVAPGGSGADVAASVYGGYLKVQGGVPTVKKLQPPVGLWTAVIWTGLPVRTSTLVGKISEFARQSPHFFQIIMGHMSTVSEAFVSAWEHGNADPLPALAQKYGQLMGALGAACSAPIITPTLFHISTLAQACGGGAKPSGAGGGDVGVAFFCDENQRDAFVLRCQAEGLMPLTLGLGAEGARFELWSPNSC